jgi:hypothetical protein
MHGQIREFFSAFDDDFSRCCVVSHIVAGVHFAMTIDHAVKIYLVKRITVL